MSTKIEVGSRLKNGALVIAYASKDGIQLVLAKSSTGTHNFVTWRVGGDGDCFWGHYFSSPSEAAEDFIERQR